MSLKLLKPVILCRKLYPSKLEMRSLSSTIGYNNSFKIQLQNKRSFPKEISKSKSTFSTPFHNNYYNNPTNTKWGILHNRISKYCSQSDKNKIPQITSFKNTTKSEKVADSNVEFKTEPSSKLFLSFTCKVCNGSNSYMISKQSYNHGVVIVTCSTCKSHHLIADNLNWFEDIKGKNIEEIMAEKGEKVRKFTSDGVKEFTLPQNSTEK